MSTQATPKDATGANPGPNRFKKTYIKTTALTLKPLSAAPTQLGLRGGESLVLKDGASRRSITMFSTCEQHGATESAKRTPARNRKSPRG